MVLNRSWGWGGGLSKGSFCGAPSTKRHHTQTATPSLDWRPTRVTPFNYRQQINPHAGLTGNPDRTWVEPPLVLFPFRFPFPMVPPVFRGPAPKPPATAGQAGWGRPLVTSQGPHRPPPPQPSLQTRWRILVTGAQQEARQVQEGPASDYLNCLSRCDASKWPGMSNWEGKNHWMCPRAGVGGTMDNPCLMSVKHEWRLYWYGIYTI